MEPTRKFRPRDKVVFALGCFVLLVSMVGEVGVVAMAMILHGGHDSNTVQFEWNKDESDKPGSNSNRFNKRWSHDSERFHQKRSHGPEKVKISGAWNVEIIKGEFFDIQFDESEDARKYSKVDRGFHSLVLKNNASYKSERSRVVITMPELESLKADGAAHIVIKGFHQKEMEIKASGASEITALHGTVYDLELNTSGAAKVDFKKCPAKNADIKLTGAARLDLTMTGGSLEGKVTGASHIVYYGDVSEIDIKSSGASGVRKG